MRGALMVALLSAALPQAPGAPDLRFHHLHVRDGRPLWRVEFYERLFDPDVVRRIAFGGVQGLETGSRRILISPPGTGGEEATALWHFGWGETSLDETYLAHAQREVNWQAPLPPEALHVHLRSVAPLAAAAWYRDILGAEVEVADSRRTVRALPPPEHRFPEARVTVCGLTFLIYPTDQPLVSSIGRGIDHVAFTCASLDESLRYFRRQQVNVISEAAPLGTARAAMIQGPDRMPIELVELPR